MKDIPIIFSGPMVRALLDGRKTMTRRLLKPQPPTREQFPGSDFGLCPSVADDVKMYSQNDYDRLPKHPTKWDLVGSVGVARDAGFPTVYNARYAAGDRLWVRENVACGACAPGKPSHWSPAFWRREQGGPANPSGLWYQADGLSPKRTMTVRGKWVPSIFMPRWVSRLTLMVTSVKIERLHEIGEEDAIAEGVYTGRDGDLGPLDISARALFADLWRSLHGSESVSANPYVVAISFNVHKANIDTPPKAAAA